MRWVGIPAFLAAALCAAPAAASGRISNSGGRGRPFNTRPFGLGVEVGSPVGVTAKLWLGDTLSMDLAVGAGFGADPHGQLDLVYDQIEVFRGRSALLRFYLGGGIRVESEDDNDRLDGKHEDEVKKDLDAGPRAVFGLEWRTPHLTPLELFLEAAPGYDFADETGTTFDAALGLRWYF